MELKEVAGLCADGHVMLVCDKKSGEFYVKKRLESYHRGIYETLMKNPVRHTPKIYEILPDGEQLIVIEEYLPGTTLAEMLEQKGVFSEKETCDIAMQLSVILKELHTFSPAIIHRDIKPPNVMLMPDGVVSLLDFNAAKPEEVQKARDTRLIGTVGFAAPEQYGFAPSSKQTDIYAMGVLMNVMLTGGLPWKKLAEGKLNTVIKRCLKINPKDRYANVSELYRELKRRAGAGREWFLPGFRTMKIYKMLIAIGGYALIAYIFMQIRVENSESMLEGYLDSSIITVVEILTVFFYCNYLDFQRLFPFMKSPKKGLRILGMVLAPMILFGAWLAFYALIGFFMGFFGLIEA